MTGWIAWIRKEYFMAQLRATISIVAFCRQLSTHPCHPDLFRRDWAIICSDHFHPPHLRTGANARLQHLRHGLFLVGFSRWRPLSCWGRRVVTIPWMRSIGNRSMVYSVRPAHDAGSFASALAAANWIVDFVLVFITPSPLSSTCWLSDDWMGTQGALFPYFSYRNSSDAIPNWPVWHDQGLPYK